MGLIGFYGHTYSQLVELTKVVSYRKIIKDSENVQTSSVVAAGPRVSNITALWAACTAQPAKLFTFPGRQILTDFVMAPCISSRRRG